MREFVILRRPFPRVLGEPGATHGRRPPLPRALRLGRRPASPATIVRIERTVLRTFHTRVIEPAAPATAAAHGRRDDAAAPSPPTYRAGTLPAPLARRLATSAPARPPSRFVPPGRQPELRRALRSTPDVSPPTEPSRRPVAALRGGAPAAARVLRRPVPAAPVAVAVTAPSAIAPVPPVLATPLDALTPAVTPTPGSEAALVETLVDRVLHRIERRAVAQHERLAGV